MQNPTRVLAALAAALILFALVAPASSAARGHRHHRHHHAHAQRLHRAPQPSIAIGERAPSAVPFQAPACADMWKTPNSARADGCRAYGWYITAALVVSPRDEVWHSTLPHCADAAGSTGPLPCGWNFDKAHPDDSTGKSFWLSEDGAAHAVTLERL